MVILLLILFSITTALWTGLLASPSQSEAMMSFHESAKPQAKDSIHLPYVYGFHSEHVPQIRITIEGVAIEMPVDTGSTGTLIGASLLPNIPKHAGTKAHHFFTSSRKLYVGRLVTLPIRFHGERGSFAVARVPVLLVDHSWLCPWYDPSTPADQFECPNGPNGEKPVVRDTSAITYMGVGFGRNRPRDGMSYAGPALNPFLNLVEINGRHVSSDRSSHSSNGYVISSQGIQLRLTPDIAKGFDFFDLSPGCTHDQDHRDWAMTNMSFTIDDQVVCHGQGLIDTGISQMYLRADADQELPSISIRNPNKNGYAKMVTRIKPGTKVTLSFPSIEKPIFSYTFTAGKSSAVAPHYVVPEKSASPAYVNTGRNLLHTVSLAFDADRGRLGFRPIAAADATSHAHL